MARGSCYPVSRVLRLRPREATFEEDVLLRSLLHIAGKQKTVESPALNRLGVQPFRTVMARAVLNARPRRVAPGVADVVRAVERDGFVAIHDYLPQTTFEAVEREARALLASGQRTTLRHGCNALEQVDLVSNRDGAPATVGWLGGDDFLFGVFEALEHHPIRRLAGHRIVERLVQGEGDDVDPETQLHSDTYFSTHKAWLYVTDVRLENAPLSYVRGSHRLSLRQLGYVYRESVGENKGSRRISDEELGERRLEVLTCRKNTLVVANTFGFHKRLRGVPGEERIAVQMSVRAHPFRPRQDVS